MDALFGSSLSLLALALALPLVLGATVSTDWVEVFRAGSYPQGTYSAADVQQMAERANASDHEAPATVDHQQEGPAFGWVDEARAKAGRLWVKFKNMPKEFAEAINERRFHTRSIELFKDGGLKSVSFLGAKAPQVKGLAPVGRIEFSDAQLADESVALNFDEDAEVDEAAQPEDEETPPNPDDAVPAPDDEGADPSNPDTPDADEPDQERPGAPARRNSDAGKGTGAAQKAKEDTERAREEEARQFSDASERTSFAAMRQKLANAESENQRLRAGAAKREREQAAADFEQFCSKQVPPRVRGRAEAVFFALKGAEEGGAITFAHEDHDSALACFKDLLGDLSFGHLFGTFAEQGPENEAEGTADDLAGAVRDSMAEQGHV